MNTYIKEIKEIVDTINNIEEELYEKQSELRALENEYDFKKSHFLMEQRKEMKAAGCTNEKMREAYIKIKFEEEINKIHQIKEQVAQKTMQLKTEYNNLKYYQELLKIIA